LLIEGVDEMGRIHGIRHEDYTSTQKKLCTQITGGKRSNGRDYDSFFTEAGELKGPFNAYLYSPAIGEAAQKLGEAVRFESSIPSKLREIAILTVASKWKAQYEWWAHEKIARKLGINGKTIKSLLEGQQPQFDHHSESLVFAFCVELTENKRISDSLYTETVELMGEKMVVELVFLIGYYTTVAMILNVFEVDIPDNSKLPSSQE
jgi:4-carboxymuconolactone decarboxylase